MIDKNILIPGGGGFAAVNAIKSLRSSSIFNGKLITTDANPLSAGFYLADSYYVLPIITDKDYWNRALEVIKKENIEIIIPTSGFDIIPYSERKEELKQLGVTCFFSDLHTIELCNNKLDFYHWTSTNNFPTPFFTDKTSEILDFPVFAKPIFGKGSRDTFLIKNQEELNYIEEKFDKMIFSEYLPGKEYTIDVLSNMNGNAIVAIPRERLETKEGISFKGAVVNNKEIIEQSMELVNKIGIKGPCCIQMKEDVDGNYKLIEINARMGGGTIMATLAGVNIPELILKIDSGIEINTNDLVFDEITVLRYYEEIIVKNE